MIRRGTLCYVVDQGGASFSGGPLLGAIVEVLGGPYHAGYHAGYYGPFPSVWHEVRTRSGMVGGVVTQNLRPISDPDADLSEWTGGKYPATVAA